MTIVWPEASDCAAYTITGGAGEPTEAQDILGFAALASDAEALAVFKGIDLTAPECEDLDWMRLLKTEHGSQSSVELARIYR